MALQNMKLQYENELLKQELKHQTELSKVKEEMSQLLLVEKDKMIDYLIKSKEVQPKIPSKVQPQVQSQAQPQVQPQVIINEVPNEVIHKVSKKELKEEEDDGTLNKKYLQKHCTTDSKQFSQNIEVTDDDYELFMSQEFIPMKEVISQVLERNLNSISLHEMGCIVLNDTVYSYLDEWTESSKGIQHIRQQLAKELRLFLLEDERFENMDKLGDDDYEENDNHRYTVVGNDYKNIKSSLPSLKQLDQYNDCTQVLIQLESQERHDSDKHIKTILQKYSTK